MLRRTWRSTLGGLLLTLLTYPAFSFAGQWINPKEAIGDPWLARLQQGRKELNPGEKEDLARYGYTGLELMTYADYNSFTGEDYDNFWRIVHISPTRHIQIKLWLERGKHLFKHYRDLLTYNGIQPEDIMLKFRLVYFYPPAQWGWGIVNFTYLRSEDFDRKYPRRKTEAWRWLPDRRKVSRGSNNDRADSFQGSEMTQDDFRWRRVWSEDHRILGEDTFDGKKCLVVESVHHDPTYYLSKRVTWIEMEHFLDLHEEQFDKKGQPLKVIRRRWRQYQPWGYWAREEWDGYNLQTQARTLLQKYDWIYDQGLPEDFFRSRELRKEYHWRNPRRDAIPPIRGLSDLSPIPQIRIAFWDHLGVKLSQKGGSLE